MMPQRNNMRGRPDNRFRYNPQGGRGGWNRPPGPGFQQKRDSSEESNSNVKQQAQSKPNTNNSINTNKPSVNATKGNAAQAGATQSPKVQPPSLMKKDVPSPVAAIAKQQNAQSPSIKAATQNRPNNTSAKTNNKSDTVVGVAENIKASPKNSNQGQGTQNRSNERGGSGNQSQNRDQQGGNQGKGQQHDRRHNQHQGPTQRYDGGHNRGGQQGRFYDYGGEPQAPQNMEPNIVELGENLFIEEKIEKKFTGRCRLFIGNLPNETTDEEFKKMFDKFGEINEVFLNKQKMFGFIRLDTRLNAEAAKKELDSASFKGRVIRVRFAAHGAALKVKNLGPVISNELLEEAFSIFGEVERAIVIVDDRGKSTSEGIVEFARKPAAQAAIKKIKEGVFLLTTSTRPITVEPLEQKNDEDGLPEKNVPKTPVFYQEREIPPRFAQRNSFEFEWGIRWKQLAEEEEQKRVLLEAEIHANRDKLLEEIELARHDYHTMQMRQELLHRQKELEHLEEQRKDLEVRRHGMQRQREERFPGLMTQESMMRQRQVEEMQGREVMDMQQVMRQEEMGRREGADRFMSGGGGSGLPPPPAPPALLMEGSGKGMMGGQTGEMQNQQQQQQQPQQRTSRFDQPPASVAGFNAGVGSASAGQAGTAAGNFGGNQAAGLQTNIGSGGTSSSTNPRPLMDEIRELENSERRAEGFAVNPKRARRF